MGRELTKAMLKSRKTRVEHGPGEAWWYVNHAQIQVCVAPEKGKASSNIVILTKRQLETALQIMNDSR